MKEDVSRKMDEKDSNWIRWENWLKRLETGFSEWLARIGFLPLLLSMAGVKFIDTFLAWTVHLYRPTLFLEREVNTLLINAFEHGRMIPFLVRQAIFYSFFIIIAILLVKFAEKRETFAFRAFAIPPTMLGLFILWLYSITMSTNIVNGLLLLNLPWPMSKFIYVLIGFPVAWASTRFGWNLRGYPVMGYMILVMTLLSFQF